MLEEWYYKRMDEIDEYIKNGIKSISSKLNTIEEINEENYKEISKKLEENCNLKLSSVCKETYICGFKDAIKLIVECFET